MWETVIYFRIGRPFENLKWDIDLRDIFLWCRNRTSIWGLDVDLNLTPTLTYFSLRIDVDFQDVLSLWYISFYWHIQVIFLVSKISILKSATITNSDLHIAANYCSWILEQFWQKNNYFAMLAFLMITQYDIIIEYYI